MRERGNILFLILLAIVLFAALTYAVNGGFRVSQDQNIPKEKATSIAAEIMQKATLVEQTVTRLRVVGDCKDTEIQFTVQNSVAYDTPSPTDKHCYVFNPAGGGLNSPAFSSEYYDPALTGATRWGNYVLAANPVINVGTDCANPYDSCADLVMFVPFLKKDICTAINKAYGINGIPQVTGNMQLNKFNDYQNTDNGTPNTGKTITGTDITGRNALCIEGKNAVYGVSGATNPTNGQALNSTSGGGTGIYFYYHVVLAR